MYKSYKILLIASILFQFFNCNSPTENVDKEIQIQPTIKQGVWGFVRFWEGNFMPFSTGTISPVERKIYIYELTSIQKVDQVDYSAFYRNIYTKVIDSSFSNSKGFFQFALPDGQYSVFIKEDSLYYSNSFDGYGNIFPFTVKKDSLTQIEFNITYKASF